MEFEDNKLVSIGMPVYNDEKFLATALDSLLDQSYSNFEIIISDDCSTDGSASICKKYAEKDRRIKYIRQEINLGISHNMEFLLHEATGEYFMWAANDDIWHSDFIRTLKNTLDQNQKVILAFCSFIQIDDFGNILNNGEFIVEDYESDSALRRLLLLIKKRSDGCGYGLFRRGSIVDVRFPVWWGINRSCAYNNIYPTLCFYLARGEYSIVPERALWLNRIKPRENINHKIPFSEHFAKAYLAFVLRKFNLILKSFWAVYKGSNKISLALKTFPHLLFSWFWIPVRHPYKKYLKYKNEKTIDMFI